MSLYCGNGDIVFHQSLIDIFQIFHHDLLGVANRSLQYCREYSCKSWQNIGKVLSLGLEYFPMAKTLISKIFQKVHHFTREDIKNSLPAGIKLSANRFWPAGHWLPMYTIYLSVSVIGMYASAFASAMTMIDDLGF